MTKKDLLRASAEYGKNSSVRNAFEMWLMSDTGPRGTCPFDMVSYDQKYHLSHKKTVAICLSFKLSSSGWFEAI